MAAEDILQEVSDENGLEWTPDSMLALVCQYIDNQCDDSCFRDFLDEQASFEVYAGRAVA
jgi:hypothetical protein